MITAHPIGHSVPFSKEVQTALVLVLGVLMLPTGNQMMNIRRIATVVPC